MNTTTTDKATCRNCGKRLTYLDKEKRRNRGYCSLNCFYQRPPKLANACEQWGMEPAKLLCHLLNDRTVEAAAGLLGVRKQALYGWMERYGVRRVVRYVAMGG